MLDRYEPLQFESKWREKWREADLFKTRTVEGKPKFYGLDFFPYPSGAGLSVGHCRNYIPTDVLCRLKVMQGFNVLHPMGFDAFGLPAENEAIKRKTHPRPMIDAYADNYKRQMDLVGISYDWSRTFKSCEPSFYKWTQWIFELLYKRGLAYRKNADVNWCPKDKTALANEEVVGGLCERCGTPVEKKAIPQWYFKITDYAQRLIDDLDDVDWPEGIKHQQRNWIGRSEGVQFAMDVVLDPATAATPQAAPRSRDPELDQLDAEVQQEGFLLDTAAHQRAEAIKAEFEASVSGIENPLNLEIASESFQRAKDKIDRDVARFGGTKSGGDFAVRSKKRLSFEVFTTRIDTIFGVTFCVLAPEHKLVDTLLQIAKEPSDEGSHSVNVEAILAYREQVKSESETTRMAENREKTGVFTGAYAVNPVTGQPIPIWIADYVLMGYGTGAIMAVPAGDQRDFEFAKKFEIPVRAIQEPDLEWLRTNVIEPCSDAELMPRYLCDPKQFKSAFVSKDAPLINAQQYTGMSFQDATQALGQWFEANELGERKVQYRLRDWLISRQRYWGCPIPVCYDKDGEPDLISENQLPVELPDVESYEPSDDGSSPLSRITDFVNCTTPDGTLGFRETDTMGGFACSSWYFLRFCDPHNDSEAWSRSIADYWMPVDCYVGGAEHAVMHLLYARFWTKVLFDLGLVSVNEPFQRLKNQGQVLGRTPYRSPKEGEKLDVGEDGILVSYEEAAQMAPEELTWKWVRMSKSKGNVVTPDEAVEQYGADALRLFELFVAPFEADVEWNSEGMNGTSRFLSRVFRLVSDIRPQYDRDWRSKISNDGDGVSRDVRRATHQAIKKCTDDLERFAFNTYVSAMMEYLNELTDHWKKRSNTPQELLSFSEAANMFVLLLAPSAPHSADEMWESLGYSGFTFDATWPTHDPELAKNDTVTIAVQVNGKLRDTVEVAAESTDEQVQETAMKSEKVTAHLEGKTVRKVIVIKGKLVNIVAN